MIKYAVIFVHSAHGYDRDDGDVTEFTTDGMYTYDDGTACITYLESEVTGMEGTRTSIIVMKDKVIVDRDGSITSRMVIQEGKKNLFQYETPFGNAVLGVEARQIQYDLDENGGTMTLDFVVDMEHAAVSRSKFDVTVKLLENGGSENG